MRLWWGGGSNFRSQYLDEDRASSPSRAVLGDDDSGSIKFCLTKSQEGEEEKKNLSHMDFMYVKYFLIRHLCSRCIKSCLVCMF